MFDLRKSLHSRIWFANGVCLCALSLIGNVHIDRTVGSDKEIFMRLSSVLYMEAEKSPKNRKFSIQCFYDVKKCTTLYTFVS